MDGGAKVNAVELIERGRWSTYSKYVIVLLSLAMLMDGVANHALPLVIPAIVEEWRVSPDRFAIIFAAGLIGQIAGAFIGGALGDRIGCKPVLIASVCGFGLATLGSALARDMNDLLWLRVAGGVAIGAAIPVAGALSAGMTPLAKRPEAVGFILTFIGVGAVASALMAGLVFPSHGWRGVFAALGAPSVALGLLFLFALPENPLFLAVRGKHPRALAATLRRCGHAVTSESQFIAVDAREATAPLSALLAGDLRRETLWLWGASFSVLLASYIVFNWLPTVLSQLNFPISTTSAAISVFGTGSIVGSLLIGPSINRLGSKTAMIWFCLGGVVTGLALAALVLSPGVSQSVLFAGLAASGFFIGALLNLIYIVGAFVYPNAVRATGLGGVASSGWLGAVVSAYVGIATLNAGASVYFVVVAVTIAVAMLCFFGMKRHIPR